MPSGDGPPAVSLLSPPASIEAEERLLGGLLQGTVDGPQWAAVQTAVPNGSLFYRPAHRIIFDAIVHVKSAGDAGKPEPVVVANHLSERGLIDKAGNYVYLAELMECAAGSSNVVAYAQIVRDRYQKRLILEHIGDAQQAILQPAGDAPASAGDSALGLAEALLKVAASAERGAGAPMVVRRDWSGLAQPRDWLIEDWLPAGRYGLVTGEGGRGKSRLMLQLAAGVAAGRSNWLGRRPTTGEYPAVAVPQAEQHLLPRTAVVWSAEDEDAEILRRLHSFGTAPDNGSRSAAITTDQIGDRLHYLDGAGDSALWVLAADGKTGRLSEAGLWVRHYCEQHNAALLVLDSLAAAYSCNENDRAMVRRFGASWDQWARETNCAVAVIGHPPKLGGSFSGSTDWQASVRWLWTFGLEAEDGAAPANGKKDKEVDVAPCLRNVKANYAKRDNARVWIRRRHDAMWCASDFNAAHQAHAPQTT